VLQRILSQIKPAPEWGPADEIMHAEYARVRASAKDRQTFRWWGHNPDVVLFVNNDDKHASNSEKADA